MFLGLGLPITRGGVLQSLAARFLSSWATASGGVVFSFEDDSYAQATQVTPDVTYTNFFLQSEDFTSASWSSVAGARVANAAIAPNGTLTADEIFQSASATEQVVYQQVSSTDATHAVSIYARRTNFDTLRLMVANDYASPTRYASCLYSFVTNTFTNGAAANWSISSSSTEDAGNGWVRVRLVVSTPSASVVGLWVGPSAQNGLAVGAGTITNSVYLWGAQLERASSVGPYAASAGSTGSVVVPGTSATVIGGARDYFRTTNFANYTGFPKQTLQSNGNFAYNRHNLLAMSERFDSAAWTKDNSTTGIAGTGPLGEANYGIRIIENTNNTHHQVTRSVTSVVGVHTLSVDARADGTNWLRLQIFDGTSRSAWFNLGAGTIGSRNANALNHTMTALGNGWFRCTLTASTANATPTAAIGGASGDNNDTGYIGSTSNGFFINRAQLNLGPTALEYMRTGDHNICPQSNTLTSWTSINAGLTQTQNAVGPDGVPNSAWTLTQTGANGADARPQNNLTVPNDSSTYIASVFVGVTSGTPTTFPALLVRLLNGSTNVQWALAVNTTTGAVACDAPAGTFGAVRQGNFWRLWVAITNNSSGNTLATLALYPSWSNILSTTYNTQNGGSAVFSAAEFELSSSATAGPTKYVPTTTAAVYNPYIELPYAWDSTGAALGYAAEEARTNLCLQNSNITSGATWTRGFNLTPLGATTLAGLPAYQFTSIGNSFSFVSQTVSGLVVGQTYTHSFFTDLAAMPAGSGATWFSDIVDNGSGAVNTSSNCTITQVGPGLYRWQQTFVAQTANHVVHSCPVDSAAGTTFRVALPQTELGAFATSPIVTTSAAVTRAADNANVGTSVLPFNASAGTLFARFRPLNVAAERRAAQLDDGTANERVVIGSNGSGVGFSDVIDGGASQALLSSGTIATSANSRVVSAWAAGDFATSVNGGTVQTDATGTLPTVTTLRLGTGQAGASILNGTAGLVAYLPRRIANVDLVNLA